MKIMLLRHGKSDWRTDAADFDRPVSDRGKRDAQRMGHFLGVQGLVPELIVSSPARRALETAEKCVKAAGATTERIVLDNRIYEASAGELREVISDYSTRADSIMLVGHNPGFDYLLESLVEGELPYTRQGKLMTTATLAVVDGSRLESLVRPSSLPARFRFELGDEVVEWERPRYYYTQSGVLPFRIRKGKVEILLISKRGKKKWGIPKGIVEPGMTAPDSAAKECEEEAGALGNVSASTLGDYTVDKWGGRCHVTVFPMEVSHLVEGWDESHKRKRKWFFAEEAQDIIRPRELVPMIDGLMARYMKVLE